MKPRISFLSGTLVGLALLLATVVPITTYAGLDIQFGATVQVGDDSDVYFAVSSRYFDQDERNIRKWNHQCKDSDDLAVALFLSRHGHESPDHVLALRSKGLSWLELGLRLGVRPDVWFVPVKRDPGPPYGKAYGHWKKNGKKSPGKMNLSDTDTKNLVAVRMLHEYYGVSVEVAMKWRSSGRDLKKITAGEYRSRHGKSHTASASMGAQSPGDKGKKKSGGKGKGKK